MPPDRPPSPFARRPGTDPAASGAGALPEPAFARTFEADALAVRGVLRAAIAKFARRISPDDSGVLELVLAEVLNNIVEHGYQGDPAGLARVVIRRMPGGLCCRVEDAGSPVPDDVLELSEDGDATLGPADSPAEGGYGWKLIHSLVEDIRYSKDGGFNRMSFRIPLPG
ncbi:MAG: ATP-binding protein [Paracoccaceae bacterium]